MYVCEEQDSQYGFVNGATVHTCHGHVQEAQHIPNCVGVLGVGYVAQNAPHQGLAPENGGGIKRSRQLIAVVQPFDLVIKTFCLFVIR